MPSRIWYANKILTPEDAQAHWLDDRGLRLGHGVFTTLLYSHGKAHDVSMHYDRLKRHAQAFHIKMPLKKKELQDAIDALAQGTDGAIAMRVTITAGAGGRGLEQVDSPQPQWFVTATPLNTMQHKALTIGLSDIRRNESSPLSRIKSLNYGDMILAKQSAVNLNWDDAVLLNSKGHLTCATVANIFVKMKGQGWVTPPLKDGVLDGITRAKILNRYNHVKEKSIAERNLAKIEAMALTNSLRGVQAVKQFWLNGRCLDLDVGAAQEIAIDYQSGGE